MGSMNEVVFLLVGLITLGMTVHAASFFVSSIEARPSRFLMLAFVLSDVTCLFTLGVGPIGPVLLTLVNSCLLLTIWSVALTARAWRKPLTRRVIGLSAAVMFLFPVAFEYMRQNRPYVDRVVFYTICSSLLLLWVLFEVYSRHRQDKAFQLKFMMGLLATGIVLRFGRMVYVLQQTHQPESLMQEEPVSAILRNTVVSMDVLVLSALLAYSTHQLALRYRQSTQDNEQVNRANRALQAVLEEKEQMLKALTSSTKSRNMGVLLASLAHELNQPLAAIRLKLEFVHSQPQLPEADRQAFLEELLADNTRVSEIVTQLRQFLRHGSAQLDRISLNRVLHDAFKVVGSELERQGVKLHYSGPQEVWIQAVESQLQMVVLNLLKNAVDVLQHQPSDKQIWVKLSTTDRHVVLTVEDNGPGIPEQKMPHVFDMFYSTKAEGMGLGLWLSRSILESQDATMTVASSDKGGACFTLTWQRPV